jgi:alkanesulfonate monooxygenase SsuD/methylene tetrahydromethanopterin reductase-like flavin-dependent oxidoreductase (luciferase family)
MIFDLFHSISDPVVNGKSNGPAKSVANFLSQAVLAEKLGMDTVWMAESHFSSETQKGTSVATIPKFFGEVGLNSDSYQWMHVLAAHTKRIAFGTGIHNIVGGSGGPIASADRANSLRFINHHFWEPRRRLRLGIASGRFPYQNTAFGLVPRDETEALLWPCLRPKAFLEALEIFLRLMRGEALASDDVARLTVSEKEARDALKDKFEAVASRVRFPYPIAPRWRFERLKLVPELPPSQELEVVLGSADPAALEIAQRYWDVGLFNLSFTPPDQIEKLHAKMDAACRATGRKWHRGRLPRTVLVFIDPDRRRARELADFVLDTYIEAMRGTAQVPDKAVLLERALIGDAAEVRDQLSPENPRRIHADDRLMLWFEFNQLDGDAIERQMKYFFKEVVEKT